MPILILNLKVLGKGNLGFYWWFGWGMTCSSILQKENPGYPFLKPSNLMKLGKNIKNIPLKLVFTGILLI